MDDLTRIKGIGATRQAWLRQALQIRTYGDLAALTAEQIAAKLKSEGRSATRAEIEQWLSAAQALASTPDQHDTLAQLATAVLTPTGSDTALQPEEWQRFASFTVEYRKQIAPDQNIAYETAAYDLDAGVRRLWPGIEGKAPCAWILDQINDKEKRPPTAETVVAPTAPIATKAPPLALHITQVGIFQPPSAILPVLIAEPARVSKGILSSAIPFVMEVTFQLAEPLAHGIEQQPGYIVQVFARDLVRHTHIALGATAPAALIAGQARYTARLPEAFLAADLYHVQVLVAIQNTRPSVAYLEVPVLQVV